MKIRSITAPNPGPFTLTGTHSWLLGDTAIIDPGPAIDSHIAAIIEAMPRLDTIFITHRHDDHAPAALPLKQATGARIIAPLDIADVRVAGGEAFDIEGESLEAIATPGHTREHICYLTSTGALFTGDTILGEGTTVIFPPDGDMGDYFRSLATLRARNPRRIHPAHGPTRDDAVALIDEYIAHRLERERQLIDALGDGAKSTAELRKQIYPQLDERLHRAAELQLTAHLVKLQQEGRVREDSGRYLRAADE
ncbi:MAG: Metallo-beta-lactamase family protein [Acidobacteria bacterium]|nr:Metallo-beta-lactamase family protein [Acidobacteriota bacterium]